AAAPNVAERPIDHTELGIDRGMHPRRRTGNQRATVVAVALRRFPSSGDVGRFAVHVGHRSMVPGSIERPHEDAVARSHGKSCTAIPVIGAHIHHAVVIYGGYLLDV